MNPAPSFYSILFKLVIVLSFNKLYAFVKYFVEYLEGAG